MDDAPEIFKLRSDDRVNQYLNRPKSIKIDEAIAFISKIENGIKNKEWFYWAISLKNDSKLTGTICLWNIDKENSRIEVGYELHPDFQGMGFMHEAFCKIIDYGFNTLKFKAIVAYLTSANKRSIRLLEKNNFNRDKVLEDEFYRNDPSAKEIIYSLRSPVKV